MKRVLWYVFNYNTVEPWLDSLTDLNEYEVHVHLYNLHNPPDGAMLDAADRFQPDLMIYTGTAGGNDIPATSTLAKLHNRCPSVFLSGDVGDPPWWPFIEEYRKAGCFDLYVNFDGNDNWPKQGKDYTTLSPIAPRFFKNGSRPIKDRAIDFGFCGTFAHSDASDPRRKILDPLFQRGGLYRKPWSPVYRTYHTVGTFLSNTKITVNCPWSGSGQVTQVKARVFEAGLGGCVLFDHVDSQARHWYEPGVEYLEYQTADDILYQLPGLLKDEDRMQSLATALQKRVHSRPASEFWKRIVETGLS